MKFKSSEVHRYIWGTFGSTSDYGINVYILASDFNKKNKFWGTYGICKFGCSPLSAKFFWEKIKIFKILGKLSWKKG